MFEKMIESSGTSAESASRRSYLALTGTSMVFIFLTALVASLFAQEFELGTSEIEMATLLAPVTAEAPKQPEPEPEPSQQTASAAKSELPRRNANILQVSENPSVVPDKISSTPSTQMARPTGRFIIADGKETQGAGLPSGTGRDTASSSDIGSGGVDSTASKAGSEPVTEPPPRKTAVERPKTVKSGGVLNGQAISLPPPPYPAPARAIGAEGSVNVQITLDETGKVVSSKAVSGHPLLRQAAERAAWNARFSPTYLTGVPVKVTGIIVYKFNKN